MSEARNVIQREVAQLDIDRVVKTDDKYAQFPYATILTWDNAAVLEHAGVIEEACKKFIVGINENEVGEIFALSSVVAAVLRKKIQKLDSQALQDFYLPLAAEDGLGMSVYESIEEGLVSEKNGNALLSAIQDNHINVDMANVNGTRLAFNLTGQPEMIGKLRDAALENLDESFTLDKIKYQRAVEVFGVGGPIIGTRVFMGSLPSVMIAASFPLTDTQADQQLVLLDDFLRE